jgi:branched-chain amino acid transport system ATP-binding protein
VRIRLCEVPILEPVDSSVLFETRDIKSGYGRSQVLFGISLHLHQGEVITLLGRNGMGKTTTVRTIMGLVPLLAGGITLDGQAIGGLPSHEIARRGLGYVPEGRRIFPNLTVRENLAMAAMPRRGGLWSAKKVIELFPRLGERLRIGGTLLSGGEQQMLAIGRALMTNPKLLILDEATEGLAPIVRDEIWSKLLALKQNGVSIIVIDKEVDAICKIADRHYVVEKGEIVWEGSTASLRSNETLLETYLGV